MNTYSIILLYYVLFYGGYREAIEHDVGSALTTPKIRLPPTVDDDPSSDLYKLPSMVKLPSQGLLQISTDLWLPILSNWPK